MKYVYKLYYSESYHQIVILRDERSDMVISLFSDRPIAGATWDKVARLDAKIHALMYPICREGV